MPGFLRSLARSPWFTGAAIATLALGLGGTTAVFRVRSGDPGAFLASAGALHAVALAAAYLPARRASRADPIRALRQE